MPRILQVLVGQRIAEARHALGMSQPQFAKAIDGHPRTVQTWEAGERLPRTATFERIAALTGRPVSWFYTQPEQQDAA